MSLNLSKNYPEVTIILLNWNGWRDTIECIESLYHSIYQNYDVIIVDNFSSDDSIKKIKQYVRGDLPVESSFFEYDTNNKPLEIVEYLKKDVDDVSTNGNKISIASSNKKLIIIKNDENYGFAQGNNIGIRYALNALNPDYLLLLNNDTVVHQDFLSNLVIFMEENHDVGLCNSVEYSYYDRETIHTAGISFNKCATVKFNAKGLKNSIFRRPFETTYASGACIFVRAGLLPMIGMLDEKMFIGAEDMDLSLRCWISGKRVMVVPESIIYHKHSVSVNKKPLNWLVYYGLRSLTRCLLKNLQLRTLMISLPCFMLYQFGSFVKDLIIRMDFKLAEAKIKAVTWNLLNLIETLRERELIQKQRIFSDSRFLNNQDWKESLYR